MRGSRDRLDAGSSGPARQPGSVIDRRGFTLLELLVTLGVLATLVTLAAPAMQGMIERNRLKVAAHAFAADLQWLRGESIRRNRTLHLTIDPHAWCYGMAEIESCDCRLDDPGAPGACALAVAGIRVLHRTSILDHPRVRVGSAGFPGTPPRTRFEPRRATAQLGSLTFASAGGGELRVVLSLLGRVRLCAPAGSVPGYPAC